MEVYTVQDVKSILKISLHSAYNLMNQDGFPSFRLNRKLLVTREDLEKWVARQRGKRFNY